MRGSGAGVRTLLGVTAVVASGCVPAMSGSSMAPEPGRLEDSRMISMLDAVATSAESRADRAPQVWLRTEAAFSGSNRVDVTYGVSEDAFVLVGMVGRDGELHILHPTGSRGAQLVSASRNQRLDNVFTGFNAPQYGTGLHMTASAVNDYGRNTGYAFAVASDRPLDLAVLDELGWWATPDLARDFQSMSPRLFAHRLASVVVQQGAQYSVDAASVRTGTYPPMAMAYSSSVCRQQGYVTMEPRLAQALIRHQLWYGCAVPQWAIRQYLGTPGLGGPPRVRPPADSSDSSAVIQDRRALNVQTREHVRRRQAANADSTEAADQEMTRRAHELRRQILEIERQRSEAVRMTRVSHPASPRARPHPASPASGTTEGRGAATAGQAEARRREAPPARSAEPAPSQTARKAPPPAPARRVPQREAKPDTKTEQKEERGRPESPQQ